MTQCHSFIVILVKPLVIISIKF
ncbi:hypothetical protein RJ641_006325 [Dillenia turbinata]|uniref:Uncharacterized protein n=1 Tax=Dillenia turbinata TaxID=194707 RepID=A0AAN8Z5Z6_9MAGN